MRATPALSLAPSIGRSVVADVRSVTARAVAIAAAVLAAEALVVIVTPRIPAVWSVVWGIGDTVTGGVEERHQLLVDHPFPAALAPPGYRLEGEDYLRRQGRNSARLGIVPAGKSER